MGNCCLQVTFQACNISEARRLYDQLAPICPVVMALSAASPVFRGYLSERDCRWNIISKLQSNEIDWKMKKKHNQINILVPFYCGQAHQWTVERTKRRNASRNPVTARLIVTFLIKGNISTISKSSTTKSITTNFAQTASTTFSPR